MVVERKLSYEEAYFRGRKLQGRKIGLPEGYRGLVVRDSGRVEKDEGEEEEVSGEEIEQEGNEEEEEGEDVKVLEEIGSFDGIIAWGHEIVLDDDDVFVKGIEEWVGFSRAVG